MSFYPGQLVVCIKADDENPPVTLTRGRIYTIRDAFDWFGEQACLLEEVVCPSGWFGYYQDNFRPLDDSKLAIFRQLLIDIPVG